MRTVAQKKTSLILNMLTVFLDGLKIPLKELVDTGCELNLLRTGLVPQKYFKEANRRISLVTANGSVLPGGN